MTGDPGARVPETLDEARAIIAQQASEIEHLRRRIDDDRLVDELREAVRLSVTASAIATPVSHARLLDMIVATAADISGTGGRLLGEADVNISSMQVGRTRRRGHALMLLSVDEPIPPALVARLRQVANFAMVQRCAYKMAPGYSEASRSGTGPSAQKTAVKVLQL